MVNCRKVENMQTIRVNSVSEYIKELENLGMENYIYRGQNEPYFGIIANGFRPYLGGWNSDKIYNIDEISKKYYKQVVSKLRPEEKEYFLALCQHYGIPTNLIDFSYSPMIALFFSCQGKSIPTFMLPELIGEATVDDLKNKSSTKEILVHNLINRFEKDMWSPYAQVYLLNKKWLLDITDIISKLGNRNFLECMYSDGSVRTALIYQLANLFRNPEIKNTEISESIIQLIESYKVNKIDFWGTDEGDDDNEGVSNDREFDDIFTFQERLRNEDLEDVILSLHSHIFGEMEDKRIPYESDIFNGFSEFGDLYELAASTYIMLLANLVQIFDNDKYGLEKLVLNLKIYFTYQPANLFDRINLQKGLFVYQPYTYSHDAVYDYNMLNIQNINPDITIEINNYQIILAELDILGINLGSVYGDLDNIAKSVVYSYKRRYKM